MLTARTATISAVVLISSVATSRAAGSGTAGVAIERVWPDKMIYSRNAPAVLLVDLKNTSDAARSVTVVFELSSELDRKEEIARQDVTLPAQGATTVRMAWTTGRRDYGHGALVSVLDKSGAMVLARKEEPFSITDNLWKVAENSHRPCAARQVMPSSRAAAMSLPAPCRRGRRFRYAQGADSGRNAAKRPGSGASVGLRA